MIMQASPEQKLIWNRYKKNPQDPGLVLTYEFEIQGPLNIPLLELAIEKTIDDHCPIFLCQFVERNNSLYITDSQINKKLLNFSSSVSDSYHDRFVPTNQVSADKLFHFDINQLKIDKHILKMSFSHLVFDGNSYSPFFRRVIVNYSRLISRKPKAARRAKELIPSVNKITRSIDMRYWNHLLTNATLNTNLPFLNPGPSTHKNFHSVIIKCKHTVSKAFIEFCQNEQLTHFQAFTLFTYILLNKYCPAETSAPTSLGYTVDQRGKDKSSIGCFTNVLPFILRTNQSDTIRETIAHIKSHRRETRDHQHTPFQDWVKGVDLKKNGGKAILNVVVNQSTGLLPPATLSLKKIKITTLKTPNLGGPFDLGLHFSTHNNQVNYSLTAPADKCSLENLKQLCKYFEQVASFCMASPSAKISEFELVQTFLPITSGREKKLSELPSVFETIHRNFKDYSNKNAILSSNKNLTYDELKLFVDQLSENILNSHDTLGLKDGIGILTSRSKHLPAGPLAALKLGVPFVPLDPDLPINRLRYIIEKSNIKLVLVDDQTKHLLNDLQLDAMSSLNYNHLELKAENKKSSMTIAQSQIAYKIFTSGSTGTPKGVKVSTENLLNFLESMKERLPLSADDNHIALTAIGFDISILELLLPLYTGAATYIADAEERLAANSIGAIIRAHQITVMQGTPSTFKMLKNANWCAPHKMLLLIGGESLDPRLFDYYHQQSHVIYNMYGPTEATIWSSLALVDRSDKISIGTPILNTKYYIVDRHMNSVPLGMPGELVIQGGATALGYIQKDHKNSFFNQKGYRDKFYRTGDMVSSQGEACLTYLGRNDRQIKLNGYRIELDEIVRSLSRITPHIDFYIVVRSNIEDYIACFYVEHNDYQFNLKDVRQNLASTLPQYMMPQAFYPLKKIPTTATGKVDLNYLSRESLDRISTLMPAPKHPLETKESLPSNNPYFPSIAKFMFENFDIADLEEASSWQEYNLNSLAFARFASLIQENFKIAFASHEFYQFLTVKELMTELDRRKNRTTIVPVANITSSKVHRNPTDIAIIGYAAALPGAKNSDELWQNLMDQKHAITSTQRPGFSKKHFAGYIDNVEMFDARFFAISPLEATKMDPRQRHLLQTTWHCLENAGYTQDDLFGKKVGCYTASTGNDYANLLIKNQQPVNPYSLSGISNSILANRISSFFNWKGPSLNIDTACSGSLTAFITACQDLKLNSADVALVAGVNLILDEDVSLGLESGRFLSPHHRCASFDAAADGYVRGEGVGAILLKPLDKALADNDCIHGVVKSYAINHGGRTNSLTAPSSTSQRDLLQAAYSQDLIQQVSFIETHGTGTKIGDLIEISGLKQAWKNYGLNQNSQKTYLGALKSNIGHLEAAAGLASIVKVLLAIKHKKLPPNINIENLNPAIDLQDTPFEILEDAKPWNSKGPLTAGVSSFGFGGTNAHIVLAEHKNIKTNRSIEEKMHIFCFSAASCLSLKNYIRTFSTFIASNKDDENISLRDISYTLNKCRTHFKYRISFCAANVIELVAQLDSASIPKLAAKWDQNNYIDPKGFYASEPFEISTNYQNGAKINWELVYSDNNYKKYNLPNYVFEKRPFGPQAIIPAESRFDVAIEGQPWK